MRYLTKKKPHSSPEKEKKSKFRKKFLEISERWGRSEYLRRGFAALKDHRRGRRNISRRRESGRSSLPKKTKKRKLLVRKYEAKK